MVAQLKIKKEAYIFPIMICLFLVPIFVNPLFINTFTQGKEILFKFIIFLTAFGIGGFFLLKKSFRIKPFYKSQLFLFLAAGTILVLLSTVLSPTPLIPLFGTYMRGFGLFTQAYLLFFVLYCASVLTEKNIAWLLKGVFFVGVAIAWYGLLQKIGLDPFFKNYDKDIFVGRIFSTLGSPGYFGQYLLLILPLGVFFSFQTKKNLHRLLYCCSILVVLAALWFSQTRTSLLALAICLILVAAKYRMVILNFLKRLKLREKIAAFIIMMAVILGLAMVPHARLSLNDDALRSVDSRFEIWKGAINLIVAKPFFGYGEETFYRYAPEIITKRFLTLEEDLNLSIDRLHNEFLETMFSYGVPAGILYLVFFGFLLGKFFKSKHSLATILLLIILANILQNQFSFSDISISILMSFCLGGLMAFELNAWPLIKVKLTRPQFTAALIAIVMIGFVAFDQTVSRPFLSQLAYASSRYAYDKSYDVAINEHKKALMYAPNHSELWYELMFLDPSSMPRALDNIERIEGQSGNLLAWKGNMYANTDPEKSGDYYLQALEKNPTYPDWIRSYADMLYKNGDLGNALFLYKQYLEAVPDFWRWRDNLAQHSQKEQTSYRIFFKNVPDFWNTIQRVSDLEYALAPDPKAKK